MKQHEDVKVRVVRRKVSRLVHRVEVLDECANLHATADARLDDTAERVGRRTLRKRELRFAVRHAFRSDEDDVEGCAGEAVGQLCPDFTRQGGLRTCAEDE